jgi:hypothetical protein
LRSKGFMKYHIVNIRSEQAQNQPASEAWKMKTVRTVINTKANTRSSIFLASQVP